MTQQVEQSVITPSEVKQAWRLSIEAADRYEDKTTPQNFAAMIEATDYAERLQALYDAQYEQWVTS